MPPLFSSPFTRLRPFPSLTPLLPRPFPLLLRRRCRCATASSSSSPADSQGRNPNVLRRRPPDKNLLKAREQLSSPALSPSSLSSTLDPAAGDPKRLLPDQAVGLVASAQANFMRVVVDYAGAAEEEEGPVRSRAGTELLCVVRAVLKKIGRRVLVGDRVLVGSVDWTDRRGMIENAFPRETELVDPPIANVDHLLVLFSLEQPRVEPFALTRFLVEAESVGIPLTLAMNKMELVPAETLSSWETRLHTWGYKPLFCSVEKRYGLAALEDVLKGKTTVIVGPSGVGKSSLINAVRGSPHDINDDETESTIHQNEGSKWFDYQPVGSVSKRSGRGKHTTRHVSLLPLPGGGYLADTPGFNQPNLIKVTKKSLAQTFPEIRQMLSASEYSKCSFSDCLHLGEPGCLVKGDWERYPYYLQLLDEIKIREEFQLRTLGTKRESDVRYKVGELGIKQAEPRLEPKKHRRVSRKRLNQSILDEFEDY